MIKMGKTMFLIVGLAALFLMIVAGIPYIGKTTTGVTDTVSCALNTDIKVLEIDGLQQACYRDHSIYLIVDNSGSNRITGLSVYLESEHNVAMKIKKEINPGEASENSIFFGQQTLEGVKGLTITPIISIDGSEVSCDEAEIKVLLSKC